MGRSRLDGFWTRSPTFFSLATPLPQMYDDDELDVCAPDDEEDDLVLDDDAARRASSWRERMRAAGFDDDDDDDLCEFVHAEACVVPQAWDEVCDDFECVYDDLYDHAGASDAQHVCRTFALCRCLR